MDDHALKQQLTGELKETLRIKQLNLELLDALESTTLFILEESERNNIPINTKRLQSLMRRVKALYDDLYGNHSQMNTQNETRKD